MITTYEAKGQKYSKKTHKNEISSSLWITEEKAVIMARQYRIMGFENVCVIEHKI